MRAGRRTADLEGEVNRLEIEVLEGHANLVELRNTTLRSEQEIVEASGLARRLLEQIEEIRVELATHEASTLSRSEHVNRLQSDLKTLESEARRLSAAAPADETPGDRLRSFVGDGDRQYLTGLKVGGQRIAILVDASASMLDETIVNIIRRRNLPLDVRRQADKWQRAVATVDWLTTQLPRSSRFQIYTFNEEAGPLVEGGEGGWLDAGSSEDLELAVAAMREAVPQGGTNLVRGLAALDALRPAPDNLILLVDGLPTMGDESSRRRTISGSKRLGLFRKAVRRIPRGVPVNVVMFPMEGDPAAAGAFWNLAVSTHGSYMSPSSDWP
jgi:hypothetical protein